MEISLKGEDARVSTNEKWDRREVYDSFRVAIQLQAKSDGIID